MTDRELLELAAKAAGIVGVWARTHQPYGDTWVEGIDCGGPVYWNPLAEDGDALRLAVKLQLTVCNEHLSAGVAYCTDADENVYPEVQSTDHQPRVNDGDYAATRRAIVLCAAHIGEGQKK